VPRDLRIAIVGAGLIGRAHIARVAAEKGATLAAIVDPSEHARELALQANAGWYPDVASMLDSEPPDAVIIATPNQTHVPIGLECVAAGLPLLVEKPLAQDLEPGRQLVEAAEAAGVPLLVGHHRRHNRALQRAKAIVDSGRLGRLTVVNALAWFFKPDAYFDVEWRREPGGGPILINLVHVVDDLRYLCGEIEEVRAIGSNAMRLFQVEDSAVATIVFRHGALGTISVSDTVVAPWSWELTTGENPDYPQTDQSCYLVGGTEGSLSFPALDVWSYPGAPGWHAPIERSQEVAPREDTLSAQLRHFCRVARGEEGPLVDGREALRTLEVTLAIAREAGAGKNEETGRSA
jgi:predicted dehydrogenase